LEYPSPLLGKQIDPEQHYIIVGAGISGLMMGFFLKEAGVSFEIKESSNRVGGLINTVEGVYGSVETGANGILWCKEIDYVAKRLNLQPLQPNQKDKKRFFVRNKQLRQFPLSVLETVGFVGRLLIPHRGAFETVANFGNAYMGAAATRQMLSPGLSGIYGTPAEGLSFKGATKKIAEILDRSRWLPLALLKGNGSAKTDKALPKGLHSFDGGMKTLVFALADHLKDHIQVNQEINSLTDGENYILTTSSQISGKLCKKRTLSDLLQSVKYQSIISSTLFFNKQQFSNFKLGFGCLIPRNEGLKSLGVLFSSVIYPSRIKDPNMLALRCILHEDDDTRKMNDEALTAFLSNELDQLFGLQGNAKDSMVHRWERGLPIYSPEHYHLLPKIDQLLKSDLPNVRLFGNYTGEISVRGACQTGYRIMKSLLEDDSKTE